MSYLDPDRAGAAFGTRLFLVISAGWIWLSSYILSDGTIAAMGPCGIVCDQAEPFLIAASAAPWIAAVCAVVLIACAALARAPRWLVVAAALLDGILLILFAGAVVLVGRL